MSFCSNLCIIVAVFHNAKIQLFWNQIHKSLDICGFNSTNVATFVDFSIECKDFTEPPQPCEWHTILDYKTALTYNIPQLVSPKDCQITDGGITPTH